MSLRNRLAAELMGTFWLVFGGCGSAVLAAAFPKLGIGFTGVALAFGLTVLTGAFGFGAPLAGGALAGFLFPLVAGESDETLAEGKAVAQVA